MTPTPERLDRRLEQRVLTFWAGVLGVETSVLDRDGLVVVHDHRDRAAGRRATVRTARGTLLLAAVDEVEAAAASPEAFAADVAARADGIALFHYLAAVPAGGTEPRARTLDARHRDLLDALHRAAGEDASVEAEVSVDDPLAVGIVENGRLLAIASLLDEGFGTVDVGVLVDPSARRRGLGSAVVAEVSRRAARSGRLVQYRNNAENEASARLARACGFTHWGVLSVAPRP